METEKVLIRFRVEQTDERFVKVPFHLLERGRFLTPKAKWIYVVVRSFQFNGSGTSFPSYPAIMERSGLSRASVARALAELEHFGWIGRDKKHGGSTTYVFFFPSRQFRVSGDEIGNQEYPTLKMAEAYRKERGRGNF